MLHLINNLHREGAQVVVFNLSTLSDENEIHHAVCVREPVGALRADLESCGIRVYAPDRYYGARETRRSLRFMQGVVRQEAAEIVHAHMADAAFLGWRLAKMCRLPLVITHHGHDLLPRCGRICRVVYYALLMGAVHYADRNVAVSGEIARRVRQMLFLGDGRVDIVGNGVPVPDEDRLPASRQVGSFPVCLITVGRLVELKGHKQLLSAVSILASEYPDLRVSIVGDGPLRGSLQQQAGLLGLGDRVSFAGSVGDVPARLGGSDIYVSTSHYEGMPMAVLEAMAWGVPVVASDVPGNRSVVEDGRTGLLYNSGNPLDLARRIREVIEQPGPAVERASRARKLVRRRYSIEASAREYFRLYNDVIQEKPVRASTHAG